jgi:hypothetical protein
MVIQDEQHWARVDGRTKTRSVVRREPVAEIHGPQEKSLTRLRPSGRGGDPDLAAPDERLDISWRLVLFGDDGKRGTVAPPALCVHHTDVG